MPQLVTHQLRVASVANMVCDFLSIDIDKDNIIKACALHDMGNIVKFNLDINHRKEYYNDTNNLEDWISVQKDFIDRYGHNDHKANLAIVKELGMSERIYDLIDNINSDLVEEMIFSSDFAKKICMYADSRVSPHGVVSIEERSLNAIERYKDHPYNFTEKERLSFVKKITEIEKQIFSLSNIKPEDINDESIRGYIEKIKNIKL